MIIGDVQEATDQFMEATEERIKFVVRKLREYVNDVKMEQILMKPIEVILLSLLSLLVHGHRRFIHIQKKTLKKIDKYC